MKFRKKPVVIEAVQWTRIEDGPPSFNNEAKLRVDPAGVPDPKRWRWRLFVVKSDAWCSLEIGDWIVREHDGVGFYPCKPDIFAATYEPVEPDGGAPREEPA